jgi:hypothetical protein
MPKRERVAAYARVSMEKDTMLHSLEMAAAALQLGQFGCRMRVLENILYLGLPLVQKAVFEGSWTQIKNQKIWRNDT